MSGCNEITAFGFRGNFCGEWQWTLSNENGLMVKSVICHVLICLIYHYSTEYLAIFFPKKSKNAKAATPATPAASAPATPAIAIATPTGEEKKKRFSIWKELVLCTPESQLFLNGFKLYHNVALSLVSFWMFVTLLWCIYQDGRLTDWHSAACKTTKMSGLYGIVNFVYLATKLWEWVDSYIMVVERKSLITLHWFHHMTTFTMAALTHNFPVGGFALINCLVHTVMYAHYASPLMWARPFITCTQLLQFVIVMSIHVYGFLNPTTCYDMKPVFWEWLYCQGVVLVYFLYFLKFFYDEYLSKGEKKTKSE